MTAKTKAREKLPRIYHFRLTDSDGDVWDEKISRSGMKISEFMREAVIHNETVVIGDASSKKKKKAVRIPTAADPDIRRRNFLLAAASRNLNQIAHRLNSDHIICQITNATYAAVLDELLGISIQLKQGL